MTDQQIAQGAGPTPVAITVQGSEQLLPKLAFAAYDGTGAAGSFLPVVRFVGPGGKIAGQAVGDVVTAGASVDQTWFRGLAKQGAAGAVTATTEYARDGGAISVPGNGTGGHLVQWAHTAGTATLLDYTTPTAPTILASGIYAVSVNVIMTTAAATPGFMAALFSAGPSAFLKGICALSAFPLDTPEVVLTMPPINLAAGDALTVDIRQNSAANRSFTLESPVGAIVTRLA